MDSRTASQRADKVANTLADAAIAHRRGDAAKAKRLYRKVLKARPGHFKALRLSGALAHETGDFDEAIRLLSAAVRHAPPDETGAVEDLGLLHLQTGELDKAEALLRRALTIDPHSLVALTRLGTTLLTCGRGPEAVETLERAREIDARDPQLAYALAHALLESREFARAVAAADAALAIDARDAGSLLVKGVALHQLERYADAEEALAQAVSLAGDDPSGWTHLGRARLARGDQDGAIEAHAKAAELSPDGPNVHGELADAHNAAGRPEAAIAVCDACLAKRPGTAAAILAKTFALRDAGRAEEADALLGLETLVDVRRIAAPPKFDDVDAFNDALTRVVRKHPSLGRVFTNRATRDAEQTGSLTVDPSPEIRSLERLLDQHVRDLKQRLRDAGLGEHPWLRAAPGRWLVNAWGVVLGEGSHEAAHLRPEAWLSGLYCVAGSPSDAGGIELGPLPEPFHAAVAPPTRRIETPPGTLLTFPSFLPRRTLPIPARGERILIVFDVFPAPI